MTADDLRVWQASMGLTYDTAAEALGISRRTYADLLNRPELDRRTALACSALAAGLKPWAGAVKPPG